MNKLLLSYLFPVLLVVSVCLPGRLHSQETNGFALSLTQTSLTCKNSDEDNAKAKLRADTTGSVPPSAQFLWQEFVDGAWERLPGLNVASPISAVGLKADTWYKLRVTDFVPVDTVLNMVDTTIFVEVELAVDSIFTEAFPQPNVVITCSPGDTVYIQNPDVTFSFENKNNEQTGSLVPIDHFLWTFEHELTSTDEHPVFTYIQTQPDPYSVTLSVYDDCGCETVFTKEVWVNPVKLKIPTVFTPNNDGVNDTWVITLDDGNGDSGSGVKAGGQNEKPLSTYYQSNELTVMNRWGRIVYHAVDYQNDWDGSNLSDGTYFYVLECKGLKEEVLYKGVVMILTK